MSRVDVEKAFAAQNQPRSLPRRFYKQAQAAPDGDDPHCVTLDGKPLRTPGRQRMALPTQALARAIADEWQACTDSIDPALMPLTRIANTVLDRVTPQRAAVVAEIARYGETDLICYRADWPEALASRQAALWDPFLAIAAQQFDAPLKTGVGVAPVTQSADALQALVKAVAATDDWRLAPLHTLVTVSGSLVIALAVLHGHAGADAGWRAGQLEADFQAEQWGADPLAQEAMQARRRDYDAALRFLQALAD